VARPWIRRSLLLFVFFLDNISFVHICACGPIVWSIRPFIYTQNLGRKSLSHIEYLSRTLVFFFFCLYDDPPGHTYQTLGMEMAAA
jgi:hypothetical protein